MGQLSTHLPQAMHFLSSNAIRRVFQSAMCRAPVLQWEMQFPQWLQRVSSRTTPFLTELMTTPKDATYSIAFVIEPASPLTSNTKYPSPSLDTSARKMFTSKS